MQEGCFQRKDCNENQVGGNIPGEKSLNHFSESLRKVAVVRCLKVFIPFCSLCKSLNKEKCCPI